MSDDFDPDADLQHVIGQSQGFDPDTDLQHHLSGDSPHKASGGKSYDNIPGIGPVPTGSPQAVAARSPLRDGLENAEAGAGKSVIDLKRGIQQITGADGIQQEIDDAGARDRPLMHSPSGLLGYVGGTLATTAIPAGLAADAARGVGLAKTAAAANVLANPATYAGAAASGAAQGALQPTETGESRLGNAALGAVAGPAGNALARGGTAVTRMVAKPLADSAGKAVQALTDAGVPLDAAQRTGSMLWNRAKIMLGDNPLTAGKQADFADMQQKAINKAFLSTIGETANSATPEVMGRAMTRLGKTYDDVASRTQIPYDHLEEPLSEILNNARLHLNDQQFATISRNADDVLQKASQNGGVINGEQFSNIKKTLDKLSGGGDRDVAEVGRDMRQALNDGLTKSAAQAGNTQDVELLKKTNQQWRNMRTIEGAIDKEGTGDISPARLATIMGQKANRSVSIYGKGDTSLSDLAQAANELLPSKFPNSGTTARLAQQAVLPTIGAGLGLAKEGDWKGVATGAAAGVALPKLAQKLLQAQGGTKAIDSLGSLMRPPNMHALAGGALQHSPDSVLQAAEDETKE